MHGGDGANIDRMQAGPVEREFVMDAGDVGELARQAVDALDGGLPS